MTFDIKKHITENNDTLGEVGCQGCGWNVEPDREKYCKTCDPSGDKEATRKKTDTNEGALNEYQGRSDTDIAIASFVESIRDSEFHLHKAAHTAKVDIQDPAIDRSFAQVLKMYRAFIKAAAELEHQVDRSKF